MMLLEGVDTVVAIGGVLWYGTRARAESPGRAETALNSLLEPVLPHTGRDEERQEEKGTPVEKWVRGTSGRVPRVGTPRASGIQVAAGRGGAGRREAGASLRVYLVMSAQCEVI